MTAVNADVSEPRDTEIAIRGARVKSGRATVLTATDIHAHNTYDQPDAVIPRESEIQMKGGLRFAFPPASVTRLILEIE